MVAAALVPSLKETVIDSAPSTTCRAVSTVPSALTTTPAPVPERPVSPLPCRVVMSTSDGAMAAWARVASAGLAASCSACRSMALLHARRDVGRGQRRLGAAGGSTA